jgi:putative hydrolase of the HAD superfamily
MWILFDAVGTLIYPDPPVAEVYYAAGRRFGSQSEIEARFRLALAAGQTGGPTSEANERERWRRIVRQVLDDVTTQRDALFEAMWNHFAQPQHWRLYDDAAATLEPLRGCGWKLGIASNFDSRLNNIVAGHPPLRSCDAVFVSSEVGYTKPDSRFFKAIEQRLQTHPGQILLVGDDEAADVQGATSAGWRVLLLKRDGFCPEGAIRTLNELLLSMRAKAAARACPAVNPPC